jgi:L-lactate dehydrogenase complex protein LldG
MSSKQTILQTIRSCTLAPAALPDLAQSWIAYNDRGKQFAEVLQSVGGKCVFVDRRDQIAAAFADHPALASAKKIVSHVPEATGNLDLDSVADPHDLEDVDFAILPGVFGVAENGAIWTTDRGLKHRAIYFIVQHLVLVLDADQIVHNMHEAYLRLKFEGRGFGAFISGPSKTADIEQSLVIGAHGPRSLTVVCVGPRASGL